MDVLLSWIHFCTDQRVLVQNSTKAMDQTFWGGSRDSSWGRSNPLAETVDVQNLQMGQKSSETQEYTTQKFARLSAS